MFLKVGAEATKPIVDGYKTTNARIDARIVVLANKKINPCFDKRFSFVSGENNF